MKFSKLLLFLCFRCQQ